MSGTAAPPVSRQRGWAASIMNRQLDSYPDTGRRTLYLAITVLATITLYYQLYVVGSVSTLLVNLHMTFTFFVLTLAFGNLIGAFGSLFAGLSDRLGRANLVVFGLLFTSVFVAFIIPAATNKWAFTIETFVVGFVEGVCLVATPADGSGCGMARSHRRTAWPGLCGVVHPRCLRWLALPTSRRARLVRLGASARCGA